MEHPIVNTGLLKLLTKCFHMQLFGFYNPFMIQIVFFLSLFSSLGTKAF